MKKRFPLLQSILIFEMIIVMLIVVWGLNRGFDFTDEGYNLLRYNGGTSLKHDIRLEHHIVRLLIPLRPTILNMRLLRFILIVISSFIFSICLLKIFAVKKSFSFNIVFALIIQASLLPLAYFPRILDYDSMSQIIIIIISGLIILELNQSTKITNKFIMGLLVALLFFAKLTTGILLAVIMFIYFLLIKRNHILAYCSGFFIVFCLFFLFVIPPKDFVKNLISGIATFQSLGIGYSKIDILNNMIITFKSCFFGFIFAFLFAFFLFVFFNNSKTFIKLKTRMIKIIMYSILFFVSLFSINWIFRINSINYKNLLLQKKIGLFLLELTQFNEIRLILFLIFCCSVFLILYNFPAVSFKIKKNLTFLLLFFLPFIGAFGTNSYYFAIMLFYLPCYMALFIILTTYFKNTSLIHVLILSVSLYFTFNLIVRYIYYPYRCKSLPEQQYHVENFPNAKGILFDQESKKFIENVKKTLEDHHYQKGDPLIVAYKMPGLVYLLEGNAVGGIVWSKNKKLDSLFSKRLLLEQFDSDKLFIVTNQKLSSAIVTSLSKIGKTFPDDFKRCVQFEADLYKKKLISVYAPKSD